MAVPKTGCDNLILSHSKISARTSVDNCQKRWRLQRRPVSQTPGLQQEGLKIGSRIYSHVGAEQQNDSLIEAVS